MATLIAWFQEHQELLQQIGVLSLLVFVATLVILPLVIIRLPEDYFIKDRREPTRRFRKHPVLWGTLVLIKNLLGVVLIFAGIAMLVLPGQGLLTILIGLALTNFPGKYTAERRIASQPAVQNTLNRIRRFAGRPPFDVPEPAPADDRSEPGTEAR